MRTFITLTIAAALFVSVAPAVLAQSAADEAAIRKTLEKAFDGLNKHDIKAHLSTLTADYENWTGSRKGLKAREEFYTERWKWQKNAQHKVIHDFRVKPILDYL